MNFNISPGETILTLLIVDVVESTLSALSGHCKLEYVADMSSSGSKWRLLVPVVVVVLYSIGGCTEAAPTSQSQP